MSRMNSDTEIYNLKNFTFVTQEICVYRLFRNSANVYLMEVVCGSVALWEVWIRLNDDEIQLYSKEGNLGLEKTAKLFSFYCYNSTYQKRYVNVIL